MTTIEKIRARCIEANPEIVELKFGCQWRDRDYLNWVIGTWIRDGVKYISFIDEDGSEWSIKEEEIAKVPKSVNIGRPIRLADVLLAIYSNDPANKTRIRLEADGQFLLMDQFGSYQLQETWNLRQDDLEKQSPETIDFIANVLGV